MHHRGIGRVEAFRASQNAGRIDEEEFDGRARDTLSVVPIGNDLAGLRIRLRMGGEGLAREPPAEIVAAERVE